MLLFNPQVIKLVVGIVIRWRVPREAKLPDQNGSLNPFSLVFSAFLSLK